jgi:hypothetical protein
VNSERIVIQELQVTPMGVIQMIYPNNTDTQSRLGIDVFQQVGCSVDGSLRRVHGAEAVMLLVAAVSGGKGCGIR